MSIFVVPFRKHIIFSLQMQRLSLRECSQTTLITVAVNSITAHSLKYEPASVCPKDHALSLWLWEVQEATWDRKGRMDFIISQAEVQTQALSCAG